MKWSDESFVDLYDLLDVWPDVEDGALRKRISDLYLEARENLEHQNHRKRFYYRELFEVQLPQARTILLDGDKRKEFDRELQLFWKNKGKPPTPRRPKDASRPKLADLPSIEGSKDPDDFSDFAEIPEEHLPPLQLPQLTMDREVVERRRDSKRRDLIRNELVATGFRWMLMGGLAAFLVLGVLTFVIKQVMELSSIIFYVISAVIIIAVSIVSGRQSMRWAKRRIIGVLSQMPYDELLRHCGG